MIVIITKDQVKDAQRIASERLVRPLTFIVYHQRQFNLVTSRDPWTTHPVLLENILDHLDEEEENNG